LNVSGCSFAETIVICVRDTEQENNTNPQLGSTV
jgi:hypothetical protein